MSLICEACGRNSPRLHPCPCGLNDCRIAYGVCGGCRSTIQRNAIDFHRERRAA